MEDPVAEIPTVIRLLTQSPPALQQDTLSRYFAPAASFTHPFCRTGSYDLNGRVSPSSFLGRVLREGGPLPLLSSRSLIGAIYRWYKVLSPSVKLGIDSIALDATHLILYVSLHQTVRFVLVPIHSVTVNLVTVLHLEKVGSLNSPRYLIRSQNDRYQVDEWIKFVSIFRVLWMAVLVWQIFASLICAIGQAALWPVVYGEEWWASRKAAEGTNALPNE